MGRDNSNYTCDCPDNARGKNCEGEEINIHYHNIMDKYDSGKILKKYNLIIFILFPFQFVFWHVSMAILQTVYVYGAIKLTYV